jgi:myo-inositol-1(or 4)-monophosphatase
MRLILTQSGDVSRVLWKKLAALSKSQKSPPFVAFRSSMRAPRGDYNPFCPFTFPFAEAGMDEFLTVCEKAARAGGKVLLDWRDKFKWHEKGPGDLVTEADFASQTTIREILLGAFPDHDFLGEEQIAGALPAGRPGGEYRWLVDPLDGTSNYVHKLQTFAVSIALERRGQILAGVVYDPVVEECYSAARGSGAFLNGKPIRTSGCTKIDEALVAVSFSSQLPRGSIEVSRFLEVLHSSQSVRRLGSAALNLAYLAAGRLDAYYATSVQSWDVAAGILLVEEAGGLVTALDGGSFQLHKPQFVAVASRSLQREMYQLLARAEAHHAANETS